MSTMTRRYMSKRQRPCDYCRARKSACLIEGHPPCRMCILHSRPCTFVEAVPPRRTLNQKRRNGDAQEEEGYTSNRETPPENETASIDMPTDPQVIDSFRENRIELPFASPYAGIDSVFPGGFDALSWEGFNPDFFHIERSLSVASRVGELTTQNEGSQTISLSTQLGDDFHEILLDSTDLSSTPHFVGATADDDPYLMLLYRLDSRGRLSFGRYTMQSVYQGPEPAHFWLIAQALFSQGREEVGLQASVNRDELRQELESVVPAAIGDRLIRLFDRFIAPQYPIFSISSYPSTTSSPPYLLAAIYCIVQPFIQFDDTLATELAYEQPPYSRLLQIALKTLAFEAYTPTLEFIQALIIILIRPSTNPHISESSIKWALHGTLITAAQTLGLHTDPKSWAIARWQIAQRRRTSFLVYATDTWIACSLGRPPLLNKENWLVISLGPEDELESGLDTDKWTNLLRYSQLTDILRNVLSRLYTLRAVGEMVSDYQKTSSVTNPLQDDLSSWNRGFQQPFSNGNNVIKTVSIINSLGYHYTQVNILRAILRPFLARGRQPVSSLPPDEVEAFRLARISTREYVETALSFIQGLDVDCVLNFWPVWAQTAFSSIGTLILQMLMISTTLEEAMGWMKTLQKARRELVIRSNQLPVLRLCLLRINSMFWKGINQVFGPEKHIHEALSSVLANPE